MKRIALFGGSGRTGIHFLQRALDQGYGVQALVRNSEKLTIRHPHLRIHQGDVLEPHDVENTIRGADLVVSLFGQVKGSPEWLQTNGTKNIVSAMKKTGVERILSLSGGGLPYPERDQPRFADRLIRTVMRLAVPGILNDAIHHHQVLAESGLRWVIVRAPRLTNGKALGRYREGWVGVNAGTRIARADLADFMLKLVEEERYVHQMPFVSY